MKMIEKKELKTDEIYGVVKAGKKKCEHKKKAPYVYWGDNMPYSKKRYGSRTKYKKYRRCVRKVKKRGGVKSPHAVCRASVYSRKKK